MFTTTATTDPTTMADLSLLSNNPTLVDAFTTFLQQHSPSVTLPPEGQDGSISTTLPQATLHHATTPSASPWITVGPDRSHLHPQVPPTAPTTLHTLNDTNRDADDEELIYSQTDLTFSSTPSPSTPSTLCPTALTSSWDIIQHQTSGADVQNIHAPEGRVWSHSSITQPFIPIKLAINSFTLCDQATNTKTFETIIDAIIASCPLKFPINRIAILSFEHAIKTRSSGNLYLSYTFLSPRLSNPYNHPPPVVSTSRRQLELLQAFLHSHLDGPEHFHNIPNLPPVASHFKVSIPFTNNMDELLHFFIEGISVTLFLGDRQVETILTLRHLGYLIFNKVRSFYSTFPSHDPFPPNLDKFRTRFAIGSLISTKKVWFSTQQQPPQHQCRPSTQCP
jgi:hypothetical protein